MQFERRRKSMKLTSEKKEGEYLHPLTLYVTPPTDVISLPEFEIFALERLQVLRTVERIGQKFVKGSPDYKEALKQELKNQNLQNFFKISTEEENVTDKMRYDYRKDYISHFLLRLAYCRTEELRRWFITQELDLFRVRFTSEKQAGVKRFLTYNGLNYTPISDEEKHKLRKKLIDSSYNLTITKVEDILFYKVHFTKVLDLVKTRKVYLKKGFAYIREDDLVSVLLSLYRSHLSHALAVTSRAFPQLEEDGRLLNIVSSLNNRYVGKDYSSDASKFGQVIPEMIDNLSKSSFPLCMQVLHETLRSNHHLKHGGRLQYGLFLKGIGLSMEDALKFWREEFTKIVDPDKFDKEYTYNIRHNYGKEGKKANYTPYSCMKIILSNTPSTGDSHGCPFKHSDVRLVQQMCQSRGVSKTGIQEIIDLVNKGHYQLACTRYFELKHNGATVDQAINHPNQYFEESQKALNSDSKPVISSSESPSTSLSSLRSSNKQEAPDISRNEEDFMDEDLSFLTDDLMY